MISSDRVTWLGYSLVALLTSLVVLYGAVLRHLAQDWWTDENYSHGFLIVPLALFFVYRRRQQLRDTPVVPSTGPGLALVVVSMVLLTAGTLGSEFFLTRVSFITTLAGLVLFLLGWAHLRLVAFPLGFLLLMIPIPAIAFNRIAFPLQLVASQLGEWIVSTVGVPVLREGNVIVLATTTLEVAEACSGIRSLVSLLTLGIIFGYFTDSRASFRVVIALTTVPIAIVANGLRVAGTGIAAHYFSPAAAQGFFHSFSGWVVFVAACLMLMLSAHLLRSILPAASAVPLAKECAQA
jgi:exosortase